MDVKTVRHLQSILVNFITNKAVRCYPAKENPPTVYPASIMYLYRDIEILNTEVGVLHWHCYSATPPPHCTVLTTLLSSPCRDLRRPLVFTNTVS